MEEPILSKELVDAFRLITEMQNAQFRRVKTMLAGFIALMERDINYMDGYMDTLLDFMEPQSDVEMVMRKYYDYIATFNAQEAKERINSLDDGMGYMSKIVYAAGLLAKELHRGQTDKGGHDYFESHLLKVASLGFDWKEKVLGFLHDAAEDTPFISIDVMERLNEKIAEIVSQDVSLWWEEWMEDIAPSACGVTHSITDEEQEEIIMALDVLNHNTVSTREEYIERLSSNYLALKVKIHDLESNMDIKRIPDPTEKDLARVERYKKEYQTLLTILDKALKDNF